MITDDLKKYVEKDFQLGATEDQVKASLEKVGWDKKAVKESLAYFDKLSKQTKKTKSQINFLPLVIIGLAVLAVLSLYIYLTSTSPAKVTVNQSTGFDAKKDDDGKRIGDLLKIQGILEKYYQDNKKYPNSLDELKDIPKNPSGGSYSYIPVGSPAQSYILNAQIETKADTQLTVKDGFLTLKGQQGKK